MSGTIRETSVATIQHGMADVDRDERLVGVVREPTGWFHAAVDENMPELGPPEELLAETKRHAEDLQMQGLCAEGAHNAAWEETDFAARYREYLDASENAKRALAALCARVRDGESVVLVCFEGSGKRCHRTVLRKRLRARVDGGR